MYFDEQGLEAAYGPGWRSGIYTPPGRKLPSPRALEALGLSADATAADVERAFRVRAKSAHPDAGGSSEAFIALTAARAAALLAIEP
jgi:hypothetical protein